MQLNNAEDARQSELQRRVPMTNAGQLVYQARIDQQKLECLYCMLQCAICNKEAVARRSFIDVYTNGVMTNTPTVTGCCMQMDRTNFMFFDDPRMGSSGKAGCCTPAPHPCPHCCECCGEVFYFNRCFGCCLPDCMPIGMGNSSMCLFLGCCSCGITDLFCGLAPGEAEKLNSVIVNARAGNYTLLQYPPLLRNSANVMGDPYLAAPQSLKSGFDTIRAEATHAGATLANLPQQGADRLGLRGAHS